MSFITKRGLSTLIPPKVRLPTRNPHMASADNSRQIASPSVRSPAAVSERSPQDPRTQPCSIHTIILHHRRNVSRDSALYTIELLEYALIS
jgi:hypothetical protein